MPSAVKVQFVKELAEELKGSEHVLLTHYQGLKADELNELRSKLAVFGAKYKVVKNRLARIALSNRGWNMDQFMTGPSALAYNGDDVAGIAKVLKEFSTKHTNLKINAGFMYGQAFDAKDVKAIADLPGRKQLLATLAATLNAPLQKLVSTINEPIRSLHGALSSLAKKKETAPAA